MEKKTIKGRKLKNPFCMPRIKGSSCARKTNFSLLDRLRDAVFRLIMLSALSKAAAATNETKSSASRSSTTYYHYSYCAQHEAHRSEAVADCIEFIKKSAAAADVEICAADHGVGSGRMSYEAASYGRGLDCSSYIV